MFFKDVVYSAIFVTQHFYCQAPLVRISEGSAVLGHLGGHFGSAERAPGSCSVVSVDPVGLSAATSGYWVSAGGHY